MAFAQCLFKRGVQGLRRRIRAVFEVLGQQILVFFDNLINQRAMRFGNRFEIALAIRVLQYFDCILAMMGR